MKTWHVQINELLRTLVNSKKIRSQIFVALSEYMNFVMNSPFWQKKNMLFFKVQTMCSNYVMPARPNSLRSWTWWVWPPSQCISEDCKKLCKNGFRIHVGLSIPLSFCITPLVHTTYISENDDKHFRHSNYGEKQCYCIGIPRLTRFQSTRSSI